MSNKRKLNKQKLPWGTLGGSAIYGEPFGDWTPFHDAVIREALFRDDDQALARLFSSHEQDPGLAGGFLEDEGDLE